MQGGEESSTADALAALQAEVRCIKHTRALQRGDPQRDPHWALPSNSEGPDARISLLETQLAQMEVSMSVCSSVLDSVHASSSIQTCCGV